MVNKKSKKLRAFYTDSQGLEALEENEGFSG